MAVVDEGRARFAARRLWSTLQEKNSETSARQLSLAELIPVPVERIARSLLGFELEEPEEINSERLGYETAGFMDRTSSRIVVAQKYPYPWRRFTIAHEIAHVVLHPEISYHRDRPLSGGEQANNSRPPEEQEADKFASELLMPSEVLAGYFTAAFGGPIDGRVLTPALTSWLLSASKQAVSEAHFFKNLRCRSLLVATISPFRPGRYFEPLAKRFLVSPTAMAIQLEDVGLVS